MTMGYAWGDLRRFGYYIKRNTGIATTNKQLSDACHYNCH